MSLNNSKPAPVFGSNGDQNQNAAGWAYNDTYNVENNGPAGNNGPTYNQSSNHLGARMGTHSIGRNTFYVSDYQL